MSFSPEWLALREPADHASINAGVRATLVAALQRRRDIRIVDLGCGAGSNLRGLLPDIARIGGQQSWTLVDYDEQLLAAAKARLAKFAPAVGVDIAYRQADFSDGEFAPLITGADVVTAAALFDLVSVAAIAKLVAAVAANRQIFTTVLTYDGIASWLPAHALDNAMRDAFNAHQHGDKGFGPAAGPDATEALAQAFSRHGYRVTRGKSPWVLDQTYARLRSELDTGFAAAVIETGRVAETDVAAWLQQRATAGTSAITIIGHEDLVASPA